MLDREHIIWAYKLFLNREPESEDGINKNLQMNNTISQVGPVKKKSGQSHIVAVIMGTWIKRLFWNRYVCATNW